MALNKGQLQREFTRIFSKPNDVPIAARELAGAYADYARSASAGGSVPTFTGAERNTLAVTLLEAMANPALGSPDRIATAWSTGVLVFWLTPPVPFAGTAGAGTPTSFPGQSALRISLVGIFSNVANTAPSAAQQLADALDVATKTVIATLTLLPGGPVPYPLM